MKLYRFRYSPFARKVQMVLDLLAHRYETIEVPYGDRNELATLTGGYVYVPVLVTDEGKVTVESRVICEQLLASDGQNSLCWSPLAGPIWGYHDFCDGPLEDVMFRIGSPHVRDAWPTAGERALYVLVKERKFGPGCVDAWQREQGELLEKARRLLTPTLETLRLQPYLFGERPSLADAALYGPCIMLEEARPGLLAELSPALVTFARRLEEYAARLGGGTHP